MKTQIIGGEKWWIPEKLLRLNNVGRGPNGKTGFPIELAVEIRKAHGRTEWSGGDPSESYVFPNGLGTLTISFQDNGGTTMDPDWTWPASRKEDIQKGFAFAFFDGVPGIKLLKGNYSVGGGQSSQIHLTTEQEAVGLALGILSERDFEGSIAKPEGLEEEYLQQYTRKRKPTGEFPDLTNNELILRAIEQDQLCWVHGGSLLGFYTSGNRRPCELDVEQLHYPSKAAAKDAGYLLTKDNIHAGCHVCNKLMDDLFGIDTPEDEMRRIVLRRAQDRQIVFLEPHQVVTETVMVEKIIHKRV